MYTLENYIPFILQNFKLKYLITRVGVENTFFVKEVIQPQVPLRLPCYDFTPVMKHTVVNALPKVRLSTSGAIHFHGMTGGVYTVSYTHLTLPTNREV